jgi:hypothetical protein
MQVRSEEGILRLAQPTSMLLANSTGFDQSGNRIEETYLSYHRQHSISLLRDN